MVWCFGIPGRDEDDKRKWSPRCDSKSFLRNEAELPGFKPHDLDHLGEEAHY